MVMQKSHRGKKKGNKAVGTEMPKRLPDKRPCILAAWHRQFVLLRPSKRSPAWATPARPGRIADNHLEGQGMLGVHKKIPANQIFLPELAEQLSSPDECANIRRGDLFKKRYIQRKNRNAHSASIYVPSVNTPKDRKQTVPANGLRAMGRAPVFTQALK